ncbi:MAG: Menaquinone-cytochrome c reductase, cytochrome B subunit, partial [uncultured Acidimicrobiales bacterium]
GENHRRQGAGCTPRRAREQAGRDRPGLPGVELDLPARFDLPQGLHGQPEEPLVRDHELGAVPPAPGEGEAPCGEGELHALPRWDELLPVHPAHGHGHLPDVLLPSDRRTGVGRHLHAADLGDLRAPRTEHAPLGGPPHGARGVPAHGPRLLPRGLQGAPGVQLGDRRHPPHPHPAAVVHRVPAALGPARAVGGDGGHEHDGLHPGLRLPGALRPPRRRRDRDRHPPALVRAPRADVPVRHRDLHGDPLLACPQGRRHLRSPL